MLTRRRFIGAAGGFAALSSPRLRALFDGCFGAVPPFGPVNPRNLISPVRELTVLPPSVRVGGLPFAEGFSGDAWANEDIPFHGPAGSPASVTEAPEIADVVIVGGGVSGLGAAMMLREAKPIVLEMRDRLGGVAQGEKWNGAAYSLGNAYVITPDPGSFLESFYEELGLAKTYRLDDHPPHIELEGRILDDFFDPQSHPPHERAAFNKYRQVVQHMANIDYPEIPVPEGIDGAWIVELDRKTFRQDIEDRMHMEIPVSLAGAIQAYCYSSFGAGWEEISAAGGWNFLAAEEFGRWVFPGGTSWMVERMWSTLSAEPGGRLRAGCRVTDVRLARGDRVLVTYVTESGASRTILAKKVVMAGPKLTAKRVIADLPAIAPRKREAMERVEYRAYLVANVLIDAPVRLDFYDAFLLGNGQMPMNEDEAQAGSRVTDMLSGTFFEGPAAQPSVLTLYWPLPFTFGRWTLLINDAWQAYAESLAPQIQFMLSMLKVPAAAVRQVRMTRWAHAMPINRPGLMADGTIADLRRPIDERIYFVNQDNWALPAVENCLLDAKIFAPQILDGL